jgi:hypothetical protein
MMGIDHNAGTICCGRPVRNEGVIDVWWIKSRVLRKPGIIYQHY